MAIIPKILEKKYYDFGMSMNQSLSRVGAMANSLGESASPVVSNLIN